MPHYKNNCLFCGAELEYNRDYKQATCVLCGQRFDTNVQCVHGHYVCDACHSLPASEFILRFCITSESKDPMAQAIALMRNPSVAMHGPEHHFLVPAVLLSAYYNVKGNRSTKEEKIKIAQRSVRSTFSVVSVVSMVIVVRR